MDNKYIERGHVYSLFGKNGIAKLHVSDIDRIPTADVAPVVHGQWICTNKAAGEYRCSVCDGMDSDCSDYYGSHSVTYQDYCPWCGAKMDLEEQKNG